MVQHSEHYFKRYYHLSNNFNKYINMISIKYEMVHKLHINTF
jgi:hypothetical protein